MKKSQAELYAKVESYLDVPFGERKYRRAFRLTRQGHLAGDPWFTNLLGYFYEHGFVVPQCKPLAFQLYKEAALKGVPIALYNVGTFLSETEGKHEEAMQWWRQGAALGDSYCLVQIGWAYEKGLGVPQDGVQAVKYYRQASEEGNDVGQANLARCYRIELGVKKDTIEMTRLLQLARDQDNAMAWFETGHMYDEEELPSENPESSAIECYEKAAELGLLHALEWCGEHFCMCEEPDFPKGLRYLNRAIHYDLPRAKFIMAILMAEGRATEFGVKQNSKKAFMLCLEAAETGEADAERMLGLMYERGDGVKQNQEQARYWLECAANHGNANAAERLEKMKESLKS